MSTNETEMATISGEEVAALLGPTLDGFEVAAQAPLRRAADKLYEMLLADVQTYLRDNAQWNIAAEIDRCRHIERENARLQSELTAAKEALEKAAGWFEEYAAEHRRKALTAPDFREQHGREVKAGVNRDRAAELRSTLSTIGGGK